MDRRLDRLVMLEQQERALEAQLEVVKRRLVREVLALREAGWPISQVAEETGLSKAALYKRVHRSK